MKSVQSPSKSKVHFHWQQNQRVGVKVSISCRKPVTEEEKAENKIISSIRIRIEHIISGVKRCRIVKDIFRNTKRYFADQVMEIACGLHNFRMTLRYNTLE